MFCNTRFFFKKLHSIGINFKGARLQKCAKSIIMVVIIEENNKNKHKMLEDK